MNKHFPVLVASALLPILSLPALGFCGFYVAKADSKLFNKASQVVLVRAGKRTVLTMANDYQGDPKEFAIVVPVPTVIKKGRGASRGQSPYRSRRCILGASPG
jgi:hypothetical protein